MALFIKLLTLNRRVYIGCVHSHPRLTPAGDDARLRFGPPESASEEKRRTKKRREAEEKSSSCVASIDTAVAPNTPRQRRRKAIKNASECEGVSKSVKKRSVHRGPLCEGIARRVRDEKSHPKHPAHPPQPRGLHERAFALFSRGSYITARFLWHHLVNVWTRGLEGSAKKNGKWPSRGCDSTHR